MKDSYNENYNTLMRGTEATHEKKKSSMFMDWILLKYPFYLKQFTDSKQFPSKFQGRFSQNQTKQAKIYMETLMTTVTKSIMNNLKKCETLL